MAGFPDLLELLEADHRRIERLLADPGQGAKLISELSSHIVAEHQLLHPTVRKHLPEGDKAADELTEIDRQLERTLAQIDEGVLQGGLAAELEELFRLHLDGQEVLFPPLRQTVPRARLEELGQQLGSTISEAPTHPHPNLPDEGPLEVIGDAVASALDQLRDALRRRR
jgi:hypothetical protein